MVRYSLADGVATITMDDGKRNALGLTMLKGLEGAFARARRDRAIVVLTGRPGVFSAGFDLQVLGGAPLPALDMLRRGFRMAATVLSHPRPVVAACNGHAVAMGLFLLLSADHVIGSRGDFKVAANEVAIGIPVPRVAAAVLEHRLTPRAYQRAVMLSAELGVDAAHAAGCFDELVDPDVLLSTAHARATAFAELDAHAHAVSKRRIRRALVRRIRRSIPLDVADAALLGVRRWMQRRG